jgi:hypothetical protein
MFGVDYELDLYPWWSRFYLSAGFDSYRIFLHRERGVISAQVREQFVRDGFEVETVGGPQGNGMLRKLLMKKYAESLPPDDFLVTADADEFQFMPFPAGKTPTLTQNIVIPYRDLFNYYDVLQGWMIDRYSDRLEACYEDPFVQYPDEEEVTKEILKIVVPPFLNRTTWPHTRRTKILAARCGADIAYEGSHCMRAVPSNAAVMEDFRVLHFAWRESAKRKAAVKSYFNQRNLDEIFGGKAPREYSDFLFRISPESLNEKVELVRD